MQTKTTPKDFFLHLGATVALYIAVGALINLWFSIINYYFPDQLAGYFYGNTVAWPISMLIVLIPILYVIEWVIWRDVKRMPEKADLWIRRWRIFLTIFLGVVLMGGDLVTLINTYLNGEITARLVWKVVVILFIAGSVGKYYFFSIYSTHRWATFARRANAWFGIVLVLAAIIIGFITVGSPTKQRELRFDTQRVNDLQNIQWQIVSYWQQKGKLPVKLADLDNSLAGFVVPTDPQTSNPYEYYNGLETEISADYPAFRICAVFARESQDVNGRGAYYDGRGYPVEYDTSYLPRPIGIKNDVWNHPSGRNCFVRIVDPEIYPPKKQ